MHATPQSFPRWTPDLAPDSVVGEQLVVVVNGARLASPHGLEQQAGTAAPARGAMPMGSADAHPGRSVPPRSPQSTPAGSPPVHVLLHTRVSPATLELRVKTADAGRSAAILAGIAARLA
jgi:hypothetical protein